MVLSDKERNDIAMEVKGYIKSYEKLVEEYPDKADYFKAKISEIENMKNNQ